MWNDTDIPLAIFFTWRTYGTWLHGDERGSVDRHQNIYRSPKIESNRHWRSFNANRLAAPPVTLDAAMRRSAEIAIREMCSIRDFHLNALNIRTNHGHAVMRIGARDPDRILGAIKANATRQMREDGCWTSDRTPWAEKGSCRRLWNERSVWEASDYVINRQGTDLTQYDWW